MGSRSSLAVTFGATWLARSSARPSSAHSRSIPPCSSMRAAAALLPPVRQVRRVLIGRHIDGVHRLSPVVPHPGKRGRGKHRSRSAACQCEQEGPRSVGSAPRRTDGQRSFHQLVRRKRQEVGEVIAEAQVADQLLRGLVVALEAALRHFAAEPFSLLVEEAGDQLSCDRLSVSASLIWLYRSCHTWDREISAVAASSIML